MGKYANGAVLALFILTLSAGFGMGYVRGKADGAEIVRPVNRGMARIEALEACVGALEGAHEAMGSLNAALERPR